MHIRKNLVNANSFIFFFLFLFSFFISFSYFQEPRALETSLLNLNWIIYEDKLNLHRVTYNNQWSLIFQFVSFLLESGLSVAEITRVTLFISTLFFTLGIFLFSKNVTESDTLGILITVISITLRKTFGDLDYPTLMFSEHINGQLGLAFITLIFGLFANKNYFLTFLASFTLLSVHILLGLWVNFILLISLIFYFKNPLFFLNNKNIISGITIGLLVSLLSLYNFLNSRIEANLIFDLQAYNEYLAFWDDHRTGYGKFWLNYSYIFKSIILLLLIFAYLKQNQKNYNANLNLSLFFLSTSIVISFLIYLTYKFFSNYYPAIVIKIIPTRYFLSHSVLGYSLIFSLIYVLLKNYFKNKYIFLLFSLILILHIFQHANNFKERFNYFFKNPSLQKTQENYLFWNKLKNYEGKGVYLTSGALCKPVTIYAYKPLLFCPRTLNYIPWTPNTAKATKDLIENIFKIPFNNPKYKNQGGLIDKELKGSIESITTEEWIAIKKKYNIEGLILPLEWNIKLEKVLYNNNYAFFKIK